MMTRIRQQAVEKVKSRSLEAQVLEEGPHASRSHAGRSRQGTGGEAGPGAIPGVREQSTL